jgi:uncharacterized membrane protein YgcG
VPVLVGSPFSPLQNHEIERAIEAAERVSGMDFSVYVGPSEGTPRTFAENLHVRLPDPDRSVLILVDPTMRQLEIVTGSIVRRTLDNRQAALAAISMQAAFSTGNLFRGLVDGIQQLAVHARPMESLHTDSPL